MTRHSRLPKRSFPIQVSNGPLSQEFISSSASNPVLRPSLRSSSNAETQESDVEEISPKIEDVDEPSGKIQVAFEIQHLTSPSFINPVENPPAKKRGRPRKSTEVVLSNPILKLGRSKTGCITCRNRKKKCDEGRPECRNCMKNSFICDGYEPKRTYQGGQKARKKGTIHEPIPRPVRSINPGIESNIDVKFFDHFYYDLSNVLTVHDNVSNPFRDIIFQMAFNDDENLLLRHSVLCISGLHLFRRDAQKIFNDRQEHHYNHYLKIMRRDCKKATTDPANVRAVDPHSMITTSIIQCLIAICRGSTDGEYRWHMDLVREFVPGYRSSDSAVKDFFDEFLMYHDGLNVTTSLDRRPASVVEEVEQSSWVAEQIAPDGVFTGVKDGLVKIIIRISRLRDQIRQRMSEGIQPIKDCPIFSGSLKIEQDLKAWRPVYKPYTPPWHFAWFHQRCVWIYLYRTLKPSKPSEELTLEVDEALGILQNLHSTESFQSVLLSPLFLLGCAAFQQWQRPPIESAFENVRAYSNLGNIDQARLVVRKVWELMDAGDERSWDWERIMADMGIDLLIT